MRALGMGVAVLAMLAAATAWGTPVEDDFWAVFDSDGEFVEGGGSGWDDGRWIYYDQTDWWNQWFYDHPPTVERWKQIRFQVCIVPLVPDDQVEVSIAVNWSTLDYINPIQPPQPDEEDFIFREEKMLGWVWGEMMFEGGVDIPGYNPEWVSIDVRLDPLDGPVLVEGHLWHECLARIPEPCTCLLLAAGLLGVGLRRRRTA